MKKGINKHNKIDHLKVCQGHDKQIDFCGNNPFLFCQFNFQKIPFLIEANISLILILHAHIQTGKNNWTNLPFGNKQTKEINKQIARLFSVWCKPPTSVPNRLINDDHWIVYLYE